MVRSVTFVAALTLMAGAAQAGGLSSCAVNGTCGSYSGTSQQGTKVVIESTKVASAQRDGSVLICPYPHRPSDSAFVGGAGYLTKDQVRRSMGCR